MKRVIAFLLALVMIIALCACGTTQKAEPTPNIEEKKREASKAAGLAYAGIMSAYDIIDIIGSDIYEAWRMGIYDKDKVSIKYLASNLNLTTDELMAGQYRKLLPEKWDTMSDEEKKNKWILITKSVSLFFGRHWQAARFHTVLTLSLTLIKPMA